MRKIFAVNVSQSEDDLFHDVLALFLIELPNKLRELSIGTVLKYDYQLGFLFVEKVLSGLDDVRVVESYVGFDFVDTVLKFFIVDLDDFKSKFFFFGRLSQVNNTRGSLTDDVE